ncbi:hypothetical protein BG57_02545 [Caballeronia grimmiae]|uniref:Uncharacterized protein n=1 Tax=Caballeronia grimmiae TaxID=1071679 RepID=A0A069P505_9BURK|nr:hypothetical protein BG57_02545 [Caballeronia grimmiae]
MRHEAILLHPFEDRQDLLIRRDGLLLLVDLIIELKNLEIGRGYACHELQIARAPVGLGRVELGFLRLYAFFHRAPDIDVPVDLRAEVVLLRERLTRGLLEAHARADIHRRQRTRSRLADLRACNSYARGQHLDIEVALDRLVDERIEIGIAKLLPPVGLDSVGGGDLRGIEGRKGGFLRRIGTLVNRHFHVDTPRQQHGRAYTRTSDGPAQR